MGMQNSIKNLKYVLAIIEDTYKTGNIPVAINLKGDRVLALQSICIDDSDSTDLPIILLEADLEDRRETAKEFEVYSQTGKFEGRRDENRLNTVKINDIRPLRDNEKIEKGDFLQVLSLEEYEETGDEITELVEKFAGKMVEVLSISKDVNEFHEHEFLVKDNEGNIVTMTSHEFNQAYREK